MLQIFNNKFYFGLDLEKCVNNGAGGRWPSPPSATPHPRLPCQLWDILQWNRLWRGGQRGKREPSNLGRSNLHKQKLPLTKLSLPVFWTQLVMLELTPFSDDPWPLPTRGGVEASTSYDTWTFLWIQPFINYLHIIHQFNK